MTNLESSSAITLSAIQDEVVSKLMAFEWMQRSSDVCHVLRTNLFSIRSDEVMGVVAHTVNLQAAFEAYNGSKVYVACRSQDLIQWRLNIRQSDIDDRRFLLNSLRGLLRVSAPLPSIASSEQKTITLSVGTKRVIADALSRQWIFAIHRFRMLMSTVANDIGLWKERTTECDSIIFNRTSELALMNQGLRGFIGGLPTVHVARGDIETWFGIVDKAVSDSRTRLDTITKLMSVVINLPVVLDAPGAMDSMKDEVVHCVASVCQKTTSEEVSAKEEWIIRLERVPTHAIFV